jgi:CheY-like chemotaxis protein
VVQCAPDANAACAIAETWKADVLVLDLAMPGEDGYSLLARLRALHGSEVEPPAIAVTGYAGVEARDRAVASGFQAHLAKPFPVDELVAVIGQLADERQGA